MLLLIPYYVTYNLIVLDAMMSSPPKQHIQAYKIVYNNKKAFTKTKNPPAYARQTCIKRSKECQGSNSKSFLFLPDVMWLATLSSALR